MATIVRMRYTGSRPCAAQGRHLAPGDVVEVPDHVARYFLIRNEGELVPDQEPEAVAVRHRDPDVTSQPGPKGRRRG